MQRAPLASMSNGGYRQSLPGRGLKQPIPSEARARPQNSLATSAGGETATFLSFVRLLASKPEEEQRMLMQVARQEAAAGPRPGRTHSAAATTGTLRRTGSAGDLRRNPLRRSASLDGSDFAGRGNGATNGHAAHSAGPSDAAQSAIGLDGRPRSADAAGYAAAAGDTFHSLNGSVMWGGAGAGSLRPGPLRQRQAQARAAAAAAQMQHQFIRRAAVTTLQAHWRGWQHRRLARYLRARRKRANRLDWLWHLEYVTNLMHWHEAAHTVQSHWRGRRDPGLKSLPATSAATDSSAASAASSAAAAKSAGNGAVANGPNSTAASLPSPPPGSPDGEDSGPESPASDESAAAASTSGAANGKPPEAKGAANGAASAATQPAEGAKAAAGEAAASGAAAGSAAAGGVAADVAASKGRPSGRATVSWKSELQEVRTYAVVPPAMPRW